MLILVLYLLLVITLTILQKKDWFNSVFRANKKVSWVVSGLSLFMLNLSVDQGQLLTGIIADHGMQGMWMIWVGWLGAFVVPIVFAPLWQKLDFITDNQFLLFRFQGKSGKILHLFRALYVGGAVVSLLLCFHLLGFARVIQIYFHLSQSTAILTTGLILCLFALKNIFDLKLKMDVFHAVIYFVSFAILFYSFWTSSEGWNDLFSFFKEHPEKKNLLPSKSDSNGWFSLIVFLGVQWWSSYLFDGGGPEMARYTAVKGKTKAILTGVFPMVISFLLGFLLLGQIFLILESSNSTENNEIFFVERVFGVVSPSLKPIILLGFFGMFITTAESLMSWGASFLTLDAYKQYLNPHSTRGNVRLVSFCSMLALSMLATILAMQIDSLQSLVKITFSIAAGVAPVYILRWIWFRINAWSQLSAMLSSAVFTLIYPEIHAMLPLNRFPMEESRVLIVTFLTTITWLAVTFLSPNQSAEVRLLLMPIIGSRRGFVKKFLLALSLGILVTIFLAFFWMWFLS